MLDIGWTELVVIAVVAILVVGPKDLPRMLRALGQTMGQLRRSANDFKRQFDDALREAEREADFEDTRKSVQSLARIDPLTGLKKSVEDGLGAANNAGGAGKGAAAAKAPEEKPAEPAGEAAGKAAPTAAKPAGKTMPAKAEKTKPAKAEKTKPAKAEKTKAEPTKAEAAEPSQARRDSDAA